MEQLIWSLGLQRLNEITDKIDNELLPALELVMNELENCKKQLSKKKKP